MGNCLSDPSASKGHTLGSAPTKKPTTTAPTSSSSRPAAASPGASDPGRMVGDGFEDVNRGKDPREMARLAAEERVKASSKRGIQASNPKAGQLSAQLAANKKKPLYGATDDDDRPMDRSQWN